MKLPFTPPELTPLQSYALKTGLKLIGAVAATHGATRFAKFIDAGDTVELVGGLIAALLGLYLGAKGSTTAAIQQQAADSLPAGTVLAATTDEQPKAQVMTPEGATEFIRKTPSQPASPTV